MFRDRKDAKWVKPKDAIQGIVPYLMDKRTDAEVSCQVEIDLTELCKWVDKQNESGKLDFKLTYFQAIIATFSMVVFNRPMLNRFVKNKRLYERYKMSASFTAKDKFSDDAEEKLICLDIDPNKNALELGHNMAIDVFKTRSEGTNDMDKVLKFFTSLPKPILTCVFNFIKFLDNHGWNPKSITEGDLNYTTLLFSNLGSIKGNSLYHHLNNYGTNSIMVTIGTIKEVDKKKMVDIQVTLDERIADGYYFIKSIHMAEYIMNNPSFLEGPLGQKIEFKD